MGKTYVIAEAGVNHNGDLSIAKEIIEAAAAAGADAVKFQTFQAETLATEQAPQAQYQIVNTGQKESQFDMLKRLELSHDDHFQLQKHCENHRIDFLSSPFDISSAAFLIKEMGLQTIKLGSGEITNAPLLHFIAQNDVKIILSSGMSNIEDIQNALGVLTLGYQKRSADNHADFANAYQKDVLANKVHLMHCTSDYPAQVQDVNLRAINTLSEEFGLPVGYSDHTLGWHVSVAAVACGAQVIEKHLTLDTDMAGPDHKASIMPQDFTDMVRSIRDIETAMGDGKKAPTQNEIATQMVARKSIVASSDIEEGDLFSAENLTTKRPAEGLSPLYYWDILGQKAQRSYKKDEMVDM